MKKSRITIECLDCGAVVKRTVDNYLVITLNNGKVGISKPHDSKIEDVELLHNACCEFIKILKNKCTHKTTKTK